MCFIAVLFATVALASSVAHAAPKGCDFEFKKQNLCASMAWTKEPSSSRAGEFRLRFWDSSKGTESGPYLKPRGTVFVKLWMPAMGHGSRPVTVTETPNAPGVYNATNVYFIMGGPWEVWTQLKDGSTIVDQAKVEVEF